MMNELPKFYLQRPSHKILHSQHLHWRTQPIFSREVHIQSSSAVLSREARCGVREVVDQLFFAGAIRSPAFYPGIKRAQQIIHRETRAPGTDVLKIGQRGCRR